MEKNEYSPEERLMGTISLSIKNGINIQDIQISLLFEENWEHGESSKSQTNTQTVYTSNIGLKEIMGQNSNNIFLKPDDYFFPFEFKLPEYLLPSFEYPNSKYHAHLRYSLVAKAIAQSSLLLSKTIYILIKSIPRFEELSIKCTKNQKVNKWGLFGKGSTDFNVYCPSKNVKISETIPISLDIDNSKGKLNITKCIIKMYRKIIFKDKENFTEKHSKEFKIYTKNIDLFIKTKEKNTINTEINLNEITNKDFMDNPKKDIPYSFEYDLKDLVSTIEANIISCSYYLKFTLYYSSFVKKSDRPRIILPINIVNKIDNDHLIIAKEVQDLDRAIELSQKEEEMRQKKLNDEVLIAENKNENSEKIEKNEKKIYNNIENDFPIESQENDISNPLLGNEIVNEYPSRESVINSQAPLPVKNVYDDIWNNKNDNNINDINNNINSNINSNINYNINDNININTNYEINNSNYYNMNNNNYIINNNMNNNMNNNNINDMNNNINNNYNYNYNNYSQNNNIINEIRDNNKINQNSNNKPIYNINAVDEDDDDYSNYINQKNDKNPKQGTNEIERESFNNFGLFD